jgi:hypothetical protein
VNFQTASCKLYKICYEKNNVIDDELTLFIDNLKKITSLQTGWMYLIQSAMF